jgi:hypothetical protein
VLCRLRDDYQRAYYAGIISERRAKAHLKKGGPVRATRPTTASARR